MLLHPTYCCTIFSFSSFLFLLCHQHFHTHTPSSLTLRLPLTTPLSAFANLPTCSPSLPFSLPSHSLTLSLLPLPRSPSLSYSPSPPSFLHLTTPVSFSLPCSPLSINANQPVRCRAFKGIYQSMVCPFPPSLSQATGRYSKSIPRDLTFLAGKEFSTILFFYVWSYSFYSFFAPALTLCVTLEYQYYFRPFYSALLISLMNEFSSQSLQMM